MGLLKAIRKFVHKQREFSRMSMQEVFTKIYHTNKWGKMESILDLPCGDFHWMKEVDLGDVDYIGADIVPDLITRVRDSHGNDKRRFLTMDLTRDELPKVDLLLCRDCWIHLVYQDIAKAIINIRRSGIKYLLTTTFTRHKNNQEKIRGNLEC